MMKSDNFLGAKGAAQPEPWAELRSCTTRKSPAPKVPAELNRAFSPPAFLFPQSRGAPLGWQMKRAFGAKHLNVQ
jgi:hypothetical protein